MIATIVQSDVDECVFCNVQDTFEMTAIDGMSFQTRGVEKMKGKVTAIESVGKVDSKGDYVVVAYENGKVYSYNMS